MDLGQFAKVVTSDRIVFVNDVAESEGFIQGEVDLQFVISATDRLRESAVFAGMSEK